MAAIYLLLLFVAVATGELDIGAPVIVKHQEVTFSSLWTATINKLYPELVNEAENEVECKKLQCLELLHNSCLKNTPQKGIKPYLSICHRGKEFTVSVVMDGMAYANVTSSKEADGSEVIVALGDKNSQYNEFNFTRTDNQIRIGLTTGKEHPRATFFNGIVERKGQEDINCLRLNFSGQEFPSMNGPFLIGMLGKCN